ncbi:hypothetical protein [Komagataeibacter intermedius]|uniref:Uncharacterized protein n=1 Tax=Komagataeibacter intermedius NRIC 0521 TaxID=1307934 RepID=A0ABQ0PGP9_9PROT|nr:hypothetical protein [Komagataeibacter intermedius]GAN86387.1 hypothetical protein Gain_0027_062 [Komagataeibacter intermedius TF2]GBQ68069.1 hypothetical protein AA0521_1145 [Komagataeibacter intermedius NRIC 0521]
MSEVKFTPGPWVAVYRGDNGGGPEGDVHQKAKWDVGLIDDGFMRGDFRWNDACLIAAAPDMYAILVDFIEYERLMDEDNHAAGMLKYADLREKVIKAIAKARGEA